jgi:hypothetical protein
MRNSAERPFSTAWLLASVTLFLAAELLIGTWLGPLIVGRYVSPAFHFQVQGLMHLASFWLGGFAVGLLSPGIRLLEPALGAFVSVVAAFSLSVFLPHTYLQFDLKKILLGGGIAVVLALFGAYTAERVMGNVEPDADDAKETARGRLRSAMWNDVDGVLAGRARRE